MIFGGGEHFLRSPFLSTSLDFFKSRSKRLKHGKSWTRVLGGRGRLRISAADLRPRTPAKDKVCWPGWQKAIDSKFGGICAVS